MATTRTKTAAASKPTIEDDGAMWAVTLTRAVEVERFLYKPGVDHTVSSAVLVLMGDAVETKTRV